VATLRDQWTEQLGVGWNVGSEVECMKGRERACTKGGEVDCTKG